MPLTKKQIAKEVGCSPALLSRGRFKAMPDFETVDEFKQWDVTTRRRGTSKFSGEIACPDPVENSKNKESGSDLSNVIDWKKFETEPENHLDVTLQRGMSISNMAYALLDAAVERGDIAATFGAIKNWSSALREESEVRGKLLEQRIAERSVIHLDEVKNVVGLVVQELVIELEVMLNRGAVKANPESPKKALDAYQEEFDKMKMRVQGALVRIENELNNNFEKEDVEEGHVELCEN